MDGTWSLDDADASRWVASLINHPHLSFVQLTYVLVPGLLVAAASSSSLLFLYYTNIE
jgi:hypothetical protein